MFLILLLLSFSEVKMILEPHMLPSRFDILLMEAVAYRYFGKTVLNPILELLQGHGFVVKVSRYWAGCSPDLFSQTWLGTSWNEKYDIRPERDNIPLSKISMQHSKIVTKFKELLLVINK